MGFLEGFESIQIKRFFKGCRGPIESRGAKTYVGSEAAPRSTQSVIRQSVLLVAVGPNPVRALKRAHLGKPLGHAARHLVLDYKFQQSTVRAS